MAVGALGMSQIPGMQALAGDPTPDVDVYAFHCGILKTQTQYIIKDTRKGVPFDIPVPFYIIRHGNSWVAYDSGNNAMVANDPIAYWGKKICAAYKPVMKPHEEFKPQIARLGLKPTDLEAVVMSHGHLDHCGALEDLAGSKVPVILHKDEVAQIKKEVKEKKEGSAYIPADFNKLGQVNLKPITGVVDMFGDGTVVIFPTPGHTPGHQSMLVRTSFGQNLILAQDACYTLENMTASIPPGLAFDIPDCMVSIYSFQGHVPHGRPAGSPS